MTVTATRRPYAIEFAADAPVPPFSKDRYPFTADEAQRLLDQNASKIVTATAHKVVMHTGSMTITLRPATRGGGAAFTITR
jgi:hypothetical protein